MPNFADRTVARAKAPGDLPKAEATLVQVADAPWADVRAARSPAAMVRCGLRFRWHARSGRRIELNASEV